MSDWNYLETHQKVLRVYIRHPVLNTRLLGCTNASLRGFDNLGLSWLRMKFVKEFSQQEGFE